MESQYKYGVVFYNEKSEKEFFALPEDIRKQLNKKLNERRNNPEVKKDKLSGHKDIYKIKITRPQVRLCYKVEKGKMILIIVVTGSRNDVYKMLDERIKN